MSKRSSGRFPTVAPSKKAPQLTAAEHVRQEVDAVFQCMAEDRTFWIPGSIAQGVDRFDRIFEDVVKLLEAEDRQDGRVDDDGDQFLSVDRGVRAGYLIGVQVGLRLRNDGGAR